MYFFQTLIKDFIQEQATAKKAEREIEKYHYHKNPEIDKNGKVVPISVAIPMDNANVSLFRVVAFQMLDSLVSELRVSRNKDDRLIAKFITQEREENNAYELRELSTLIKKKLKVKATGGEYTLADIAKVFGLTRERVRQIEESASRKLRHPAVARKIKLSYDKNN